MILFGSLCTIFAKIIGTKVNILSDSNEAGSVLMAATKFRHSLFMNLLMFIGEAILLLVLVFKLHTNPTAAALHVKNKANPWLFAAPAFLDACGSFLNFTGLALISASSFYMLTMLSMVFTVFLSVVFLRKNYSWT